MQRINLVAALMAVFSMLAAGETSRSSSRVSLPAMRQLISQMADVAWTPSPAEPFLNHSPVKVHCRGHVLRTAIMVIYANVANGPHY
jgi:hypothetical protein